MSGKKLKIAVFSSKSYDQQFITAANKDQHEVNFLPIKLNLQTVPLTKDVDAICIFVNDVCDKQVLQKLSENGVKLILLRCAGFNNVDLLEAKKLGIKVYRVPAYSPYAVAEHAVALLLTLNRKVHKAYQRVRDQNFSLEGLLGFDIRGKTVGVMGTGKIGAVFAEIMKGFGCKLIGYDVYQNADLVKTTGLEYVSQDELYKQADIISMHLPLLPSTNHMLNTEAFSKMKDGVYIINTSRGGIIDSKSAIQALKSGKIGGLGLDVYEEESEIFFEDLSGQILQDDVFARLLTFPNVIITGHQAFFTREAWENIAGTTCQNVEDYLNNRDANELTKTVKAEEIANDTKSHKVVSVDEKAVNKLRQSFSNLRASQEKKD